MPSSARARRRARRLRVLAGVLALLLVVSIVGGVAAIGQRNRADRTAKRRVRRAARGRGAQRRRRPARPVAAPRRAGPPARAIECDRRRARGGARPRAARRRVLGAAPAGRGRQRPRARWPVPDGHVLAVPGTDGVVYLLDRNWRVVRALRGFPAGSFGFGGGVAVSADGSRVLASGARHRHGVGHRDRSSDRAALSRARRRSTGRSTARSSPRSTRRIGTVCTRWRTSSRRTATRRRARSCTGTCATRNSPRGSDASTRSRPAPTTRPTTPRRISVSPDGRFVAAGSYAQGDQLRVGCRRRRPAAAPKALDGVAGPFTPDGKLALAPVGRIVFVDPSTGSIQGPPLTRVPAPEPRDRRQPRRSLRRRVRPGSTPRCASST